MLHMMVDIESLDTTPSTVICSLGAVVFEDQRMEIVSKRVWNCNWQAQLNQGRTVSEATLRWWLEQEEAARQALLRRGYELSQVLHELRAFWNSSKPERVWANGTDFDIAALAHAYAHNNPALVAGETTPWKYNQARDLRLFKDLLPDSVYQSIKPPVVKHNAMQDAIFQAEYVMECLRLLRGGFNPTHQHYKGRMYEVIADSALGNMLRDHLEGETGEVLLTVYRSQDIWYAQPRERFYSDVDVDGQKRPRFLPAGK
jgi:hypothetical protein